MKLSTRLVLLFLLISLLPLGAIGYFGYRHGIKAMKQGTADRLVTTNALKAAEVNRWIKGARSQLKALAQRPLVRVYTAILVNESALSSELQSARLHLLRDHFKPHISYGLGILNLSILRRLDGKVVTSSESRLEGRFLDERPFFLQGQQGTFVDEMIFDVETGQMVMHVSTPIMGSDGKVIAVLVGHLDWQEMTLIMAQGLERSTSEESYLVNQSNYFVTESRFAEDYPLKKKIDTLGVRQCLDGRDGIQLYDDYRGIPVIGAFKWMPKWHLCLLTEVDQTEAYAPVVTFRNVFAGVGIAATFAAALLSWLFARAIASRIQRLVTGAREIGKGNLDYRIETRAGDEIDQLAHSFNAMAQARKISESIIRKSHDEMEARVGERTAEITRANEKLEDSLAEKEVLLREIHHRVKNNMQMIQSLINLQAKKIEQPELKSALAEANSRIRSMALIHETLYRSEDLACLDLDQYFQYLVKHLHKLYHHEQDGIEIDLNVHALKLDLDCSIACGLIVNELVTNALKYAFDSGSKGRLTVVLRRGDNGMAELVVADNGKGMPSQDGIGTHSSLGLKIVSMLAEDQLQGQIEVDVQSGTRFSIQFPLSSALRGQT